MKHQARCIDNAEASVRENCADQLTAAVWDEAAMEAENAWVTTWALEWLNDGTSTCVCDEAMAVAR
jgi:hypothetical protein